MVEQAGRVQKRPPPIEKRPPRITEHQRSDLFLAMSDALIHPGRWLDAFDQPLSLERWKEQVAKLKSERNGDATPEPVF